MKRSVIIVFLVLLILPVVSGQTSKVKNNPLGKWMFEAPYAPQGFTAGTIEVAYSDQKFSATMAFNGSENKFAGNSVKFENDTLSFRVYIEDQNVAVVLSFLDETKMTGKAVYSEGVVPLSMIREKKKE